MGMAEPSSAACDTPSCADPDIAWIVTEGRQQTSLANVLAGLCRHLYETGLPISRVMLSQRTLHPLVAARGIPRDPTAFVGAIRVHATDGAAHVAS